MMNDVIVALLQFGPDAESRKRIYRHLIPVWEGHDCDTLDECLEIDPAFDDVMEELKPHWFENQDE